MFVNNSQNVYKVNNVNNVQSSNNVNDTEEVENLFGSGETASNYELEEYPDISYEDLSDEAKNEIISQMEAEIAKKEKELENKKDSQGLVGKVVSFFGGGTSKETKSLDELKTQLNKVKETGSAEEIEDIYEKILGQSLDPNQYEKIQASVNLVSNLDASTKTAVRDMLAYQIDNMQDTLDTTRDNNGIIAKAWDWTKNTLGIGASSNKAQAELDTLKEMLDDCDDDNLASVYKSIMGEDLTPEEIVKFGQGESSLYESEASESVMKYKQGQKTAVDTIAAVGSTLAVIGTVAAGVIAAPFTAGASIAGTVALIGIGAGTYFGIEAADGLTEKDGYSFDEIKEDAAMAIINGTVATMTAGLSGIGTTEGSVVAKSLMSKGLSQKAAQFATNEIIALSAGEGLGLGKYTVDTLLMGNGEFTLEGLAKTAVTTGTSSLAAGAIGFLGGSGLRPIMTQGSSPLSQILGRFGSAAVTGFAAGGGAAFVGGGTAYLLNTEGEEINFKDWLDSSTEHVAQGVLTGMGTALAFEAVMYAAGAPAPKNTARTETEKLDTGLDVKYYYDKDGNIIGIDANAQDLKALLEMSPENSNALVDMNNSNSFNAQQARDLVAQGIEPTTRTVRFAFNPDGGQIINYDYAGNFDFMKFPNPMSSNETSVPMIDEKNNIFMQGAETNNLPANDEVMEIVYVDNNAINQMMAKVPVGAESEMSIATYNSLGSVGSNPPSVNPADISPAIVPQPTIQQLTPSQQIPQNSTMQVTFEGDKAWERASDTVSRIKEANELAISMLDDKNKITIGNRELFLTEAQKTSYLKVLSQMSGKPVNLGIATQLVMSDVMLPEAIATLCDIDITGCTSQEEIFTALVDAYLTDPSKFDSIGIDSSYIDAYLSRDSLGSSIPSSRIGSEEMGGDKVVHEICSAIESKLTYDKDSANKWQDFCADSEIYKQYAALTELYEAELKSALGSNYDLIGDPEHLICRILQRDSVFDVSNLGNLSTIEHTDIEEIPTFVSELSEVINKINSGEISLDFDKKGVCYIDFMQGQLMIYKDNNGQIKIGTYEYKFSDGQTWEKDMPYLPHESW
ncbi:hypothetical protein II906_03325 [bacterium]|nr:hypothetical protein [bacterium]